ncbi:MAG: hypothetical protein GWN87_17810 [Desulfuromonadales bacterium]|nr:hypothetical protein [Desulfuromonadales bacterium]
MQNLFPQDTLLEQLQAQSYVGLPLVDGAGKTLGVLAVLHREPLDNIPVATSLMQIFASRAAAEFQRQAQEAQLRDSEARYRKLSQEFRTILHGIPDQITLLTPGLDIIWSNRPEQGDEATNIFRHCFEVCDGTVKACCSCPAHDCFAKGKVQEDLVSRGDRRFGVKFFPLKSDNGEVHSVICMAVDITEKMRLREDAERASRLASLGEVAAGVAHEINNPNALIRINANVLRDLLPELQKVLDRYRDEHGDFPLGKMPYSRLRAEIPKLVGEVEHSSARIRRIVESLREFVSPTFAKEKTVVDLAGLARNAAEMVTRVHPTLRIDLEFEARTTPQVLADADSLKQVVINLLMNAVQSLEASPSPISIVLDAHRKEGILEVRDQGCGIDPQNLEKLTEPFFTTRREEGGTGLGLAICSRIVKEQGGRLEFESEPGVGTTARLVFPVHQEGLVNE